MVQTTATGRAKRLRVTFIALLVVGVTITLLCVALLVGTFRNDAAIEERLGRTTAEVLAVGFDRTLVRFETPDREVHIPEQGVLYPRGLEEGQLVLVEYDQDKPELVRVAGRTASLSLMPLGMVLVGTWLVLVPILWWLRRSGASLRG